MNAVHWLSLSHLIQTSKFISLDSRNFPIIYLNYQQYCLSRWAHNRFCAIALEHHVESSTRIIPLGRWNCPRWIAALFHGESGASVWLRSWGCWRSPGVWGVAEKARARRKNEFVREVKARNGTNRRTCRIPRNFGLRKCKYAKLSSFPDKLQVFHRSQIHFLISPASRAAISSCHFGPSLGRHSSARLWLKCICRRSSSS